MNYLFLTPLYNDWDSLRILLRNLNNELKKKEIQSEVIVVNDCSTKNEKLKKNNLKFIRNLNKMKIFIYKTFTIFAFIVLTFYLTFGFIKREIKREFINFSSKENLTLIKNKIKTDLENGLKKENLLYKEDAVLIKKYFIKLKKELSLD